MNFNTTLSTICPIVFLFLLITSGWSYAQVNTFPYSESFENGPAGWTTPGPADDAWELGVASTSVFSIENQPCINNALYTDLDADYPNLGTGLDSAMLYSPIFDCSGFSADPILSFSTIRLLENCCDEIWLEMSVDSGASWTKVIGPGQNWYNDTGNQWWDNDASSWETASVVLAGAAGASAMQLRFVFTSDGSVNDEGVGIDNIYIGDANTYIDLELVELIAPASGANLSAVEPITVIVQNNGNSLVNAANYSVCFNGDLPLTCEAGASNLAPGQTDTITLTSTADLSAIGDYSLQLYVSSNGADGSSCNDSISTIISNVQIVSTYPYIQQFEAGPNGWTGSNSWSLGSANTPQLGVSNACTGGNVWATNLNGNYGANALDYLYSPGFDCSGFSADPVISFSVNRVLENCCDELWLEMSLDNGLSWSKVLGPGQNWYNDMVNQWWDDNSNGWQIASTTLVGAAGVNQVQIRFVLSSDGSVQAEGVAIDNIYLGDANYVDLELLEILSPVSGANLSSSEAITLVVRNKGAGTASSSDFNLCVFGDAPYACESTNINIPAYTTDTITLTGSLDISSAGSYIFGYSVSTIDPDLNSCNDTLFHKITNFQIIDSFPYRENFEANDGGWSGTESLWEYGIPTTPLLGLDKGCSANVWATRLQNNYPIEQSKALYSPFFDFTSMSFTPHIWFQVNYDIENLADFAVLEMSIDSGTNWMMVNDVHLNYSTTNNWTGTSSGWVDVAAAVPAATAAVAQFRILFESNSINSNQEGIAVDNFYIGDSAYLDLEIRAVLAPTDGSNLSTAESITVVIANNGYATANFTDYSVCYSGDLPVNCETTSINLPGQSLDTFTFSSTVDLSTLGSYDLDFYLSLLNSDQNPCNDSLSIEIESFECTITLPYKETFEQANHGWTAFNNDLTAQNGSWELGQLNASIMKESIPNNAWATNLSGNYLNNDISWVQSPCMDLTNLCHPRVELDIWRRTENSWDGAVLQYSLDNGDTWITLGGFNDPYNWYNDNSINANPGGSQEGWTGELDSDWVKASHDLSAIAGEAGVIFRILFASDSSIPKEGFAFDNFHVYDVAGISMTDPVACAGDSIELSVTLDTNAVGNISYLWSTGEMSQHIRVPVPGMYTVSVSTDSCGLITDTITLDMSEPVGLNWSMDSLSACDQTTLDAGTNSSNSASYSWSTGDTSQSIDLYAPFSGFVEVNVQVPYCTDELDSVFIQLLEGPLLNLGPDIDACEGDTIELNAGTSTLSYNWSNGGTDPILQVAASGLYTLVVTDSNSCSSTDSIHLTFYPNPVFSLGNDTTICIQNPLILDAGAGYNAYTWSTGASTQTDSAASTNTYSVTVVDANGCEATDDIVVTVDSCVGIRYDDTIIDAHLNIIPNPNEGIFILELAAQNLNNLQIEVFNLNGQAIYRKYVGSSQEFYSTTITLSDLPTAIYLLRVCTSTGCLNRRLIIKKQ